MTVKTDKFQMNGVLANKIFTQKDFLESFDISWHFYIFPDLNKILRNSKMSEMPENWISIKFKYWWSWQKPTIF